MRRKQPPYPRSAIARRKTDARVRRPIAARNRRAIELLDAWLRDDSGYDEETWPIVKKLIEENRLSDRSQFRD